MGGEVLGFVGALAGHLQDEEFQGVGDLFGGELGGEGVDDVHLARVGGPGAAVDRHHSRNEITSARSGTASGLP